MPTLIVLALLLAAVIVLIVRQRVGRVTVHEFQRGLRYQKDRVAGLVEPGVHWIWRPSTTIQLVDVRQSVLSVPGQEVVTSEPTPTTPTTPSPIPLTGLGAPGSANAYTVASRRSRIPRYAFQGPTASSRLAASDE